MRIKYILILMLVPLFLITSASAAVYSATTDATGYFTSSTGTSLTWAELRSFSGPIATVTTNASNLYAKLYSDTTSNKWEQLIRGYMRFPTTQTSGGSAIVSATLYYYIGAETHTFSDVDAIAFVDFYPDNDPPVIADCDEFDFTNEPIAVISPLGSIGTGWHSIDVTDYANYGDYTWIGVVIDRDRTDTPPTWMSAKTDQVSIPFDGSANKAYILYSVGEPTPTPTPTLAPGTIAVNLLEKYSNAALINQAVTVTPTAGGAGETKTSLYGETLHFGITPGEEYWFNASRAGYQDYNETYTIPSSPGIYTLYMERTLTPIANHSYAHFSVVDQTNGGLIPNAEIRLSDGQTKLTNSAGYAWFSVNNSEQINYYVSKPSGYWPAYGAMNLTADESILVALQRYTGPTATATMPGWTPVTVPTTGTGVDPVVTLSAQLRQQNVQEGMDVWYTNLPFISQFLFLLFIIGGLGLMAGGTRRN
jgi:hypothetical protein